MDIYPCAKFHCNIFTGSFTPNMWNITLLWLFVVLSWLYFFLRIAPIGRTPKQTLTVYGLNNASLSKNVPFDGWMRNHNFKGFKPIKTLRKGQNHKIAISMTAKIASTPNFDRVIEQHSWLRGSSRITKFKFKMAKRSHIAKCWKCYNSPTNGPIWTKLWWSHPIISAVAWLQIRPELCKRCL